MCISWHVGNLEKFIRQTCTTSAKEDKIEKSPLDYKWYKEIYEYKGQVVKRKAILTNHEDWLNFKVNIELRNAKKDIIPRK
jgi:hypothetical protein